MDLLKLKLRKYMIKNKSDNNLTFESAMNELEGLVELIDNDNISLDKVVEVFERGTFLMNYCNISIIYIKHPLHYISRAYIKINFYSLLIINCCIFY